MPSRDTLTRKNEKKKKTERKIQGKKSINRDISMRNSSRNVPNPVTKRNIK